MDLLDYLPTSESVVQLEPEELAGFLLEYLVAAVATNTTEHFGRYNFMLTVNELYADPAVTNAFMEAWAWLVREGLLVETEAGWYFVSRRGLRLESRQNLATYRVGNVLPRAALHPVIAERVWASFLRGDYDTAIFQAIKEVEVAVRAAGGYSTTDLGKDLMAKAFHPATGPLSDKTLPEAEREAIRQLFMGAVGTFKNPLSHRHVGLDDHREAAEIVGFASLLMRIIDFRKGSAAF